MQHQDRRRAGSFGDDAKQYDRARPTYPAALIDYLVAGGADQVVDVGCGTGIAARLFAARGCQVLGIEADARMASVARNYGLAVEDGTFEAWKPAGRQFDLITSAQAWHWVDPVHGSEKAAEALRPGGHIGVFWNRGCPPAELGAALDAAYRQVVPVAGRGYASRSAVEAPDEGCQIAAGAFEADGRFERVTTRSFAHTIEYTTAQWLDQLPTHSDHRTLPPEQLTALLAVVGEEIDRFGGSFEMKFRTWLIEAWTPPPEGRSSR